MFNVRERIENYPLHDSQRGHFGFELYKAMESNSYIFLLTGDLGYGMFDPHKADFKDRFINCGASEQAMLGIAVGLSKAGKIPFVYSITPFLLYRPFEVIRNYVNAENLHIVLVGGGRNDDYAHDGASHHAFEDDHIMQALPNIDPHWPDTKEDIPALLQLAIDNKTPTYINLRR